MVSKDTLRSLIIGMLIAFLFGLARKINFLNIIKNKNIK